MRLRCKAKVRVSAIAGSGGGRIAVASGTCLYDIDAHRLPRPATASGQSERPSSRPTNHSPLRAARDFHWLSITWIRYAWTDVLVIGRSGLVVRSRRPSSMFFSSHTSEQTSIYLLNFHEFLIRPYCAAAPVPRLCSG